MARRSGGQLNENSGRVEKGRMPKGCTEDPATFRENQIARLAGDAATAAFRGLTRRR